MKTNHSIQLVLPGILDGHTAPTHSVEFATALVSNNVLQTAVASAYEASGHHVRRMFLGKEDRGAPTEADIEKIVKDYDGGLKGIQPFIPSLGVAYALGGLTMNGALADAVGDGEELPKDPPVITYRYNILHEGKSETEITIKMTPTQLFWDEILKTEAESSVQA
jgi:hypothetical protein